MRASRVARETARLFENAATTSTPLRRSSRTSTLAARFSYNTNASSSASLTKVEESDGEEEDDVKLSFGSDIEDAITTTRAAKRRRTATSEITTSQTIQSSPGRRTTQVKTERTTIKSEAGSDSDFLSSLSDNEDIKSAIKEEPKPTPTPRGRARKPARRVTSPSGTTTMTPPSDWEEIYNIVKEMRLHGPAANAAVDTMGCERLADPSSTVKDRRFHTLVALMLSSQTKDTVNAEAMKRLHTELPPFEPGAPVGLNLDNMLHCPPAVLNELIGKVGFHNNKTKYLLQTAQILKDKFNGDIPPTIEGLVSLPGVGPKMAHLCMSAENGWNRVEGIGVDVHVHRITNYWGWTGPKETKTPEETRMALQSWLPKDKWKEINWLLVGLGQSVCLPVGRRCGDCEVGLKGLCKAADRKKVNEGKKRKGGVKKEEAAAVVAEKMETGEDGEGGTVVKQEQQRMVKMEVVDEGMPSPQPDPESNVAVPSVEQDVKPVIKDEEDVEMARSVPQSTSVKAEVDDLDDDMIKKEEEDTVRMEQASHQPEPSEDVEMEDSPEVKVEVKTEPRRRRRIPAAITAGEQSGDSEPEESGAEVEVEVKTEPLRRRARIPAHIPFRGEPEVKVEFKTEFNRRVRIPAHIPARNEPEVSEDEADDDAEVKTEMKHEPISRRARIPAHIPEQQPPEVKVEVKTEPIRRQARIPANVPDRSEVKREPGVKQEDS
ncbi:putative endonuclease III [Triangularia setosa]|uniref:Endonuclease III homolog n=1 Tax=Triangularia setosa TaxID=2587417 RepID=A0AAN6VXR8_9PEZI|nr:putative endonuclease III [Podospora setosa]